MATDMLSRLGAYYGFKLSEMFRPPEKAEHFDTLKLFGNVTADRTQSPQEFEAIKASIEGLGSDAVFAQWSHSPVLSTEVATPMGLIATTERCSQSLRGHARTTQDPAQADTCKRADREMARYSADCVFALEQVMTLKAA